MTAEATATTLLASPVRRQIVEMLEDLPIEPSIHEPHRRAVGLTASTIGERLGLHVTTVRFHVDQLVHVGALVTNDVRHGVGRPRRHYAIAD